MGGGEYLVAYINKKILQNYSSSCVPHTLGKIKSARVVDRQKRHYSIIFETKSPHKAVFDAVVGAQDVFDADIFYRFKIVSNKIIRVSRYGNTAKCMETEYLKQYCYCND